MFSWRHDRVTLVNLPLNPASVSTFPRYMQYFCRFLVFIPGLWIKRHMGGFLREALNTVSLHIPM